MKETLLVLDSVRSKREDTVFTAKRALALSFALILALSIAVVGCAKELSAQEIIDKTLAASASAEVFNFDTDMTMSLEVTGGTDPGKMNMLTDMSGYADSKNKELQMTMNMNLDVLGELSQNISADMYMVDDWVYMKLDMLGIGEQWVKTKLSEEQWEQQNQFAQQVDFLKTAAEITLAGSEKVDDVDSYVLEVKPDMQMLTDWFLAMQQQQPGVDLSQIDLAKMFKTVSIKEWIDKKSFLPVKAEVVLGLEVLPEDIEATPEDFEKMTLSLEVDMKFHDFGTRTRVELPQEALNAQELPAE
ncbi:MAG: hypothetical protein HY662_02670 [Chloroflexi bacterium]|nr:hypothetical protein [Chloroflexota bacterium]